LAKSERQTWIVLALLVAGIALTVIVGIYQYVRANSAPLHPDLQAIRSAENSDPLPKWAAAAKRGRQIARESLATQNLPGLSIAVGAGGEIAWAEGFGWANLETREPVDPDTRFRIGHASVPLTSVGAAHLIEQGRLRLDADIQDYVPAFPRKTFPVTLRQLMGNVAGVRHYRDTEWGDKPTVHCNRASEGLPSFSNDPLLFEPETNYQYSTYGWVLVSAAIEAAAKEPFFDFMRIKVFEPLGMRHTSADSAAMAPVPGRATSYFRGNFGNAITTAVDYSCFAGGGGFLSTPSDLVTFGLAMMAGSFLQPETVHKLQARQILTSGKETDYGLGWMLDTANIGGDRVRFAGHASQTLEGASTQFWMFADRGLVVAISSNMSFAGLRDVALKIAQAFAEPMK
jgi:serine beta-lactamase-like protein LACTB